MPGSTRNPTRNKTAAPSLHALNRLVYGDLAGLFDGPSTARFDPNLPMVTLDLSRISGSDQLIALVVTCASAWMEAALQDPRSPQRYIVYDEAWRTLKEPSPPRPNAVPMETGSIPGHLQHDDHPRPLRPRRRRRSEQPKPQPRPRGLLRDCSTKVIYAQQPDQIPHTVDALGLTTTEGQELLTLTRGEALWRVGADRTFIVTHRITSHEQNLFDTNTRMLAKSDALPGIPTDTEDLPEPVHQL